MLTLRVAVSGEKPVQLQISAGATVRDLKKRFGSLTRQNVSDLSARVHSRVLPEAAVLGAIAFPDGDPSITLAPLPPHPLTVALPGSPPIRTRYSDDTQAQTAVAEVYDSLGLACPANSSLIYRNRPLPPDVRLGDLDLSDDATLTIREPPRKLTVRYRPDRGAKKTVIGRYRSTATAEQVKLSIADRLGIDARETILMQNGRVIDDEARLGDLGLAPSDALELQDIAYDLDFLDDPRAEYSRVDFRCSNGKLIRARFSEDATVGTARARISEALQVPPEAISVRVPHDEVRLRDLSIASGPRSPPRSPVRALVIRTWNGRLARARYTDAATVGDLKERLSASLNVAPDAIEVPGGEDDAQPVAELPTADEGLVEVTRRPVVVTKPLLLRLPGGKTMHTKFRMKSTVKEVKRTLVNVVGVRSARIVLGFDGEVMPDDAVLEELDLPANGCIDVSVVDQP
jgi:hypothetical protein